MKIIQIVVFFLIAAFSGGLFAGGYCPQSADRLQEYSRCLAPLPNGRGMRYVGTLANLDEDHIELMNALQTQAIVPPQVVPATPYYYPMYNSPYSMMGALAYAYPSRAPAFWWTMQFGYPLY